MKDGHTVSLKPTWEKDVQQTKYLNGVSKTMPILKFIVRKEKFISK